MKGKEYLKVLFLNHEIVRLSCDSKPTKTKITNKQNHSNVWYPTNNINYIKPGDDSNRNIYKVNREETGPPLRLRSTVTHEHCTGVIRTIEGTRDHIVQRDPSGLCKGRGLDLGR